MRSALQASGYTAAGVHPFLTSPAPTTKITWNYLEGKEQYVFFLSRLFLYPEKHKTTPRRVIALAHSGHIEKGPSLTLQVWKPRDLGSPSCCWSAGGSVGSSVTWGWASSQLAPGHGLFLVLAVLLSLK